MSTSKVNDHEAHAKQLRDRAEECRRLAGIVGDEPAKASYIQLAEAYEKLAQQEAMMEPRVQIEEMLGNLRSGNAM
jgi:hypothetical protein